MKLSTPEIRAVIKDLYEQGHGASYIAKVYSVDKTAIYYQLKRIGVPIRPRSTNGTKRHLACDHHFFDEINTEEKAYWLGFVAADGNVCQGSFRLGLSTKDIAHIEMLKLALGSEHKINTTIRRRDTPVNGHVIGEFSSSSLQIKSPELCAGLAKHGVFPAKSHTLEWPMMLSEEMLRHYVRGYIDGDGCWGNYSSGLYIKVVSSEKFLIGLRDYFSIVCDKQNRANISQRKSSGEIFVWNTTGNRQLALFANFLYADATVYLPRKRAVVEPFLI